MRERRKGLGCAAALLVALAAGCAPWHGNREGEGTGDAMAVDLVESVAGALGRGPVVWVGVRDGSGRSTPEARALDEHLLSALIERSVPVARVDTGGVEWPSGVALPRDVWDGLDEAVALGARVRAEGRWAYVRLWAMEARTGDVLAVRMGRLPLTELERLAERMPHRGGTAGTADVIQTGFTLLVTRLEGGGTRQVEVQEKGTLLVGDRLQTRFQPSTDCEMYAFLYDSQGVRSDVFASRLVYAGRSYYGPGQEKWITLGEGDRVYTLYVVAAQRLPEDWSDLWNRMAELVQQGRVDRFRGLSLQDAAVTEFLSRGLPADSVLTVHRAPTADRGDAEEVILEDGTRLEARPEILQGHGALVRALSFITQ